MPVAKAYPLDQKTAFLLLSLSAFPRSAQFVDGAESSVASDLPGPSIGDLLLWTTAIHRWRGISLVEVVGDSGDIPCLPGIPCRLEPA